MVINKGVETIITLLLQIILVIVSFLAGVLLARYKSKIQQSKAEQSAVIGIFSGVIHDEEKLKLYQDVALPLAAKAGLEVVGFSEKPIVIEGEWPHPGFVVVEKFASMEAWRAYIESGAYLEAKKLRDAACTMDFVIGIDAHDK